MSISAKTFKEIVIAFLLSILAVANASPHIMLSGYQRQLYFILLFLCLAAAFIKVLNGTKIKKRIYFMYCNSCSNVYFSTC